MAVDVAGPSGVSQEQRKVIAPENEVLEGESFGEDASYDQQRDTEYDSTQEFGEIPKSLFDPPPRYPKKKTFPCPECGKAFVLKKRRDLHLSILHKEEVLTKCKYCEVMFAKPKHRINHERLHEEDEIEWMNYNDDPELQQLHQYPALPSA